MANYMFAKGGRGSWTAKLWGMEQKPELKIDLAVVLKNRFPVGGLDEKPLFQRQ